MQPVGRTFSTDFKAKVALAALKADKTFAELEKEFAVPSELIISWKQQVIDNIALIFEHSDSNEGQQGNQTNKPHHAKIGEIIAENDFLTKVLGR